MNSNGVIWSLFCGSYGSQLRQSGWLSASFCDKKRIAERIQFSAIYDLWYPRVIIVIIATIVSVVQHDQTSRPWTRTQLKEQSQNKVLEIFPQEQNQSQWQYPWSLTA